MTRFVPIAALLAFSACFCLQAQSADLRANIPFDFRMGDVLMPAGEYMIHQSASLVTLRNESGHGGALSLTLPVSRKAAQEQGTLEFNRYGDAYFLAKIWTPNARDGRGLPKSTREKEYISRNGLVQTAGIPLMTK